MTHRLPDELLEKGLISPDQFEKIDPITSGKIVSLFYELRIALYLGVLLFTTGSGILIYKNISDAGHIVSIALLILLTITCFYYSFRFARPFSLDKTEAPTPYYDHIVLLGSILFILILGYLEFLYNFLETSPEAITLLTAIFFFYIAYRFDHIGVLSLGITSLASFWSISITPENWYHGNFENFSHLYNTAIIFSISMSLFAFFLDKKAVKQHFTFTYLHFSALIFFVGTISGLFIDEWYGIYVILIYAGCLFAYYMARWKKSFLFLIYAFASAYIGTTYFLADTIFSNTPEIWSIYSIASCGGFVYFIIRFKNYFRQSL